MNHEFSKSHVNIRRIAVTGILSALSIALNFTPIGFMLIPGLQVQITLMHVPVIIGAILEGPIVGAFIGMIFGLTSLYTATYTPLPIAFAFLNPLVSVLPRILIGIVAYYSYSALNKAFKEKGQVLSIGVSSILATATNTIGVLGMIYILYAQRFIDALGLTGKVSGTYIFAMAFPNAPLEIVAAVLLSVPVVLAIRKMRR
ncbi:MAG: ECF transporter S component [Clostridiaceae bacterium]|nr:ECF transporter S component [Clostridiaceae bacterium]